MNIGKLSANDKIKLESIVEYLWNFLLSGQSFLQSLILPAQSHIQGTEQEVPGIYIVGHPPTPPEKVYTIAWISIGVLFILTGLLQYLLKKWWLKDGKSAGGQEACTSTDNCISTDASDISAGSNNPGRPDELPPTGSDSASGPDSDVPNPGNKTYDSPPVSTKTPSGKKSALINFAIIIICILFFFISLEAVLQIYVYYNPYQVFIPDPQAHWKINPAIQRKFAAPAGDSTDTFSRDSARNDGLVDFEYSRFKEDGTYRILCYGDSQTMGAPWVGGMQNSYPKMLQSKLRKAFPGKKIQVINMGVSGYSSYQGLLFFRNIGLLYNPDCVIIGLGFHDAGASYAPDKDITSDKPWVKTMRGLLYKSQIYLMIRKKILERRAHSEKNENRPIFNRVTKEDYRNNLRTFMDLGKENRINMIFLTVPQVGSEGTMHSDYVEVMRKAAKDFNIPLIDAVEAMKKIPQKDQADYFVEDEVHFNIKGNDFISDRIFEVIKPILEEKQK